MLSYTKPRKVEDPLGFWKPFDYYDFVDLGCGRRPRRLPMVAHRNPEWKILGIDPAMIESNLRENAHLINAPAHIALERLINGSIGIANADYFFHQNGPTYEDKVLELLKQKLSQDGEIHVGHSRKNDNDSRALFLEHDYEITDSVAWIPRDFMFSRTGMYNSSEGNRLMTSQSEDDRKLANEYQPLIFFATLPAF